MVTRKGMASQEPTHTIGGFLYLNCLEDRMATYSEKLKDPRWQQKRLSVLDRDAWSCANCGEKSKTLHVHHLRYKKGCEPWEYDIDDLETICEDCHSLHHSRKKFIQSFLETADVCALESVFDLCEYMAKKESIDPCYVKLFLDSNWHDMEMLWSERNRENG